MILLIVARKGRSGSVPRECGDDPDTDSASYNSGYSRRGFVAGMFVIVIAGLIILN